MNDINPYLMETLITGTGVAAAAALLGSFTLLRRMALVSDALTHVALPGIALGLLFHFNVLLGSFLFLVLGALTIWAVEHKTKLPVDTVTGILFTLALAIGTLLTPNQEIFEALFGNINAIKPSDVWIVSIASIFIISILLAFSKKLILTMISPDLTLSLKSKPHTIELLFLLIFALTVAIGIKFIGTLLMGALIIIPAATARNIARSMNAYAKLSVVFGIIGTDAGIIFARLFNLPPGPIVVFCASFLFFVSLTLRKR